MCLSTLIPQEVALEKIGKNLLTLTNSITDRRLLVRNILTVWIKYNLYKRHINTVCPTQIRNDENLNT